LPASDDERKNTRDKSQPAPTVNPTREAPHYTLDRVKEPVARDGAGGFFTARFEGGPGNGGLAWIIEVVDYH
jgi:hypothetical protein